MAGKTNAGPTLSYNGLSRTAYDALLDYMQDVGGVTVTRSSDVASSITGADTEIQLQYDAASQTLRTQFADVPRGLETYYWGHAFHRMFVLAKKVRS